MSREHLGSPGVSLLQVTHYQELASLAKGESSATMRKGVADARVLQGTRFSARRMLHCNAGTGSKDLQKYCRLQAEAQCSLKQALSTLHFSPRAYDRILKVARTIADLAGCEDIQGEHISEAIQYRTLDRQLWLLVSSDQGWP